MAKDAFLKIAGIDGESTDDVHKNWIEINSFQHDVSQAIGGAASSQGGLSGEKVSHGVFTIEKNIDKATPKLFDKCCTGQTIDEIELSLNRSAGGSGDKVQYMHWKFGPVLITKVETVYDEKRGTLPVERVSWTYGKVAWTYTQQKMADGTGGGQVAAGWDLMKNKAV